ncbi:tandem-95 repeat protein [Aliivibrio fischeri]|uniref:tandem-95 repeat protein n=1 Tax=Aliivibrio fischeri TaxID=668 RepID=UPI0012DA00C1|nr:tandem-95 repeat protein [Aliivibrio fischeri]MUK61846.1 tandem-95 repeat protein [Aliivibrio fischeri]MUL21883.1 tandem-95 repeat protein [Aliivibrio fischeri]MUL25902.1 tandem-95 repeat protein [Aliivibrio fischeri]
MVSENQGNQNNQDLNEAVEQTETNEAGSSSQQQNQQNQQNSIASTIATGAENTDISDEANQAMTDDPSGAGTNDDSISGATGGAVQEEGASDNDSGDVAQSNVVGGASETDSEEAASGSSGSAAGVGAQSVGGDVSGAGSGTDAEGNDAQAQAVQTSADQSGSSASDRVIQQDIDDFDSETIEETFAVDFQASDEETISEVEDDFDSETVSETFKIKVENENDAPEAEQDLAYIMDEDGSITFTQEQLLEYASDVDGDELIASNVQVGVDATIQDNGDGTFTVVPSADFNGELDLTFDISDGQETISSAIALTVRPINDAPAPEDKTFEIEEDGTLVFSDADLLAGATDIEGDNLTVESVTYDGGDGILTDNGNGTYTFAPNENFNGDVNFGFDVSDGIDTVSANIDVSVTPENDPPVAGSTSYTVNEDNSITISNVQLLATSSDIEGDVSIDSVTYSGSDGVLEINGNGTYTFSPNENFSGEILLDVVVADEDGVTDATTAGINVLEVNDPPVAGTTSYTIDEDSVLTFNESQVLLNASDVEGGVELVGINYDGPDGIFSVNGDGTCSFAPNENFNGQVQLDVTIRDEDGEEVETVINVDVLPINDAPVSGDLAYTINEDSSITLSQEQLLAQAGDIDSDNLEAINLSTDENATIQHNDDGSYTITPNADYNGDLDLNFDIIDNDGGSVQVGLDITVNPVNDLPQAQDQQFTIEEDGTLLFTDADLLAGASDIDGDELTIENVLYTGADGVLSDHGDGTYSFAPNENFNGDVQFSFDVSDGTDSTPAVIDVSVTPENDPPVAGSTSYTVQEDGQITISGEQLLANSSDVEGDVSLFGVTYSGDDGSFVDNGNGTYTFTPNENFDGDISLDVVVVDEDGVTATTTAGIDVIGVNDGPETSGIQAEVDEDNAITITQEQLLANATDVEGDELTATNLQTNDPDATIVANDDGSFTITHTENFNGELDFTYNINDGENEVLTTLDLTVNPVNDAPEAGDEIFIQAQEDQTVGVTLREEPTLRLDQAPENGIIEANVNDEWVVLEVGQEVPADTEVRFVPSEDALANGTHTTQIGTFDDNASVDDWGTEVDPYTRQFSDGDLTVTVQSNDDPLGAWNGNTHIGHGIGDTDRQGLSGDEKLTISVEGQDINEISFHLDGLGGWFMEESRHFTEVEIRAFNEDGDMIDSMTYHKEDRGTFETDYTLTVDQPVSYFELGTVQGNGTYVVQNMTISQTCHDEAVFTSIGVDGSEITETINLNIHEGDSEIELTAELPNITIDTAGSTDFASVIITEEQLLAQASDIDSDNLDIQNLELVGENSEHATLTDNGDGTWTVTPDENFHGEIELGYQVTDGELTDSNIININFESVNDAPIVSGPIVLSTDEDEGITFSADELLANTTDVEGDTLSISDITYGGDNGELVDNGDGTFTFMPNENFNGEIDIDYKVFDGTDEVATHLDLTVVPVNDVPIPGEPLHTQMLENGSIIIEAKDLLSGATDVDGDILHVENLLLADQTQGTLTDNGDNTFTFEPAEDFYGEVNLTFNISDGQASVPSTATVDVEIVNEGPEVSGPIEAAVDEDGSITITQEDLLANATDVDGDNLEAVNLATNDPNAVIVENSDGSFTITPSADFFGEIEFTYDVTDAIETVAADLNLTVNPINDAPDVPDMSFTTEDGQAITITEAELLAQATDIEGDELSVVNVTSASDTVEVTDNGDGTYTLTPEQGFFGNIDLAFDVSDGTDVVAANINLKVEFVNDAPEATPMVADVDEDGSILVTQEMLLESASDQDGDELFASSLETNDPNASIVDNGDGTYTVTPSENFNGDIVFTYEVSDGELSTSNDMTLTVNSVNDTPIVAPGIYHIEEDGSILFTQEDLLSGAIDIDGDDLSVTSINYSGDEGTVTDNGDGTFSFVPEEHFSGDLQFSFTVTDGTDEVEQDLYIHIEAVADSPDLVITDGDGINVDDEAILVEPGGIVELNIAAALVDQDLSETLTVTVDGVPEGSVISYDNEGVLNDQDNGITSYSDTEITVTFEGETAGYQNTAGYYKVDEDGNITGVEVVYENASQVSGGGDLVPGQDQFSFQVAEGESFNLFLIPNGYQHNDFDAMQGGQYEFRAADGSPANMDTVDPQLVFVAADGTETVIQGQNGDAIFHGGSSAQLNQDGIEHTRTTINEDGELVYGFEDLYGGGDADYTDFNFTIDVGEVNSQIYSGEVTVGSDGTVNLPTTAIENALQIQLPEDFNEQFEVHVTATATELSNDDSETVSQTIYINATGAHIEHAPEALPVAATVEEDGSIIITQEDLLANARDLDGDQLTALNLATDDDNVTITDNGDGTYTLTPDADFNGDVSFRFDVSDGDDIVSTNLELTVSPVNDGPEAQDQAFIVNEDGVLTFTDQDLLTGSTDIEGDDLSVEGVTYTGTDGVLTDNGDGTYSFSPNENFNGDVNFSFDVSDGTDTVQANIDVSVTPENDPPVAGSTSYTVHEDNSITISNEQLLANTSDIEGEVAIDSVTYSGSDGVLEINGNGTYTFSPNENFNGEVSLDVVVVDEDGATTATTASLDVLPINDPPVSGNLAYSIDEDGSITLTQEQLLSQASDVDGDDLTASNLSAGDHATVVDNGDGTFTVTPDVDFNGNIDLSFDISDGTESIVANADLTVNPINDLPTSDDVYANVDEDNIITITQEQLLANAADIEGDELVASNLTLVGDNATIVDNGDGTFSITPSENFNGYIDVAYSISDGDTPIAANLGLTVDPVNDAPIVSADVAITIEEDGSYTITQEELLQFATDIEDDDMTAIIEEQGDETTVTGTVLDAETGNPVAGADVTLTDSAGHSYTTVTDPSGNYSVSGPIVNQGSVTIEQEGSITSSFLVPAGEDVNGGVTAISEVLEETDMRIVVTWGENPRDMDNHLWLYDTESGGELDHIYYRDMSHDLGEGNIVQQDVDDTNGGGPETITIPNYQDADMHYSVHNYTNRSWDVDGVEDVQVQVFVGNTLVETFTPDLPDNPTGEHWHVFDIVNGIIVPSQDVGSENAFDLPTIEEALAAENGIDISELLTTDEGDDSDDVSGNEPSVGDISIENALITDNGDGTYTITPEENFNGEFSISYNVDDGNGGVTPAELDVTVTAVNDLSVIYDHNYTINEDGSLTFTDEQLLAGATDIDGDDLSVESVNYEGTDGVFTDNGDGTYSFAPNENFNGNVDLTYAVSDGTEVVSANIDVQVIPINDVPVAGSTTYSVEEDGSITLSNAQLLANSSDVEGEVFVSDVSYSGTDGVFTDNGDGTYTFSPNENFNGDISLDVSVMDEDGATAETTAGIDVIAVNDLPVAGSTTYSVDEDNVITISDAQLLANSSDIEGDVSVSDVSYSGTDGIFIDNGDGTYSFAPNENFNGNVSLDVTVADEDGATAQTTAAIDVIAVNDAPVSGDLAYSVDEDGSITLSQDQLLAQASDVDGDDLTAANLTAGDNAMVTVNDDGSFTITPDADFNGDIDLSFELSDGTETVIATADLTVNPVNDIAIVEDVAYTIEEDGSLTFTDEQLLAAASDIDGDELSVVDVSYTGAEGVFTDNGDGTYSFVPNENFNGDVNLGFTVTDGTETVDANIDVTVTDVNDAPVAGATSYQMHEDGTITISPEQLIANSSDVDGEVSLESVSYSGSDGTLVQNDNGSVTFTPNENFNGDISLDVVVTDDDGATATTTAGIEVLAVNDGPESEDVNLTTAEDSTILITQDMLLAQATDIDNTADELSASGLQIDPSLGELLDNEDGTWSFTPNENFNGDVPMTFNVSDGQDTISVDGNIDVTPVNDAPEAPTIEMQGEEDVVMVIDPAYIADQVTDLDGDEISIESITVRAPANATLTQQPDGMYHLVTTQDFNGLVELGYQATDGEEVVDGSLNVNVIPVNDAPFNVGNAMMTTNEDGAFTFDAGDLMNLFGDIDTADLVVSRIITADGEDGGEVTDNGDGTWTFTPTGDFAGVSDLQVIVSDGEFETVLDVPVFVRPVADGAVITTDHDGPLVFGEDETGHLGLNVGLVDDSETLSNLVMTGFPVGFEVTDGVNTVMITEPGQYIDLFDWDISNIQMTPPEDFHGEFFVTVSATTVDYGDEPEAFEDGIDSGDFETLAGDSIILTADDLIGLAENVDADSDDEVKLVHLADRSQGEIVDNGDGTWTFTPAPGFTGEADIAYVVDKDGVLHDEQTGVVVKEGDSQENATPEVNSITTTEIAADATLSFTDEDMLANLSDAEGDSLSIESVSLMEGQGVIESDNQGNYQFTPAEDYTGDVQVGFIATDGENRIESFFNVDIQASDEAASEGYALAEDGSLTITESQLVDELGVSDTAQVVDVADANDAGFFAESGEGEWTYWPNEDFDGNLAMNVDVNDGGEVSSHSLSIQVTDDSAQSDEPQVQVAQATEEQQVEVAQQADDQAQDTEGETEDSAADVTAAPGDTISISIPDEVSGNESVDYAEMSGLPEGSTVSNALDNGDGSFTISGNLEQSVSVELPEGYEGTSEIQFQGYDELGSSIEGASGSIEVEVDDQYTMQGSTQEQQPDMAGMESGGSDWTSAGGQDQGVDFTDDSGSFDSDSQTGTEHSNDIDTSI